MEKDHQLINNQHVVSIFSKAKFIVDWFCKHLP